MQVFTGYVIKSNILGYYAKGNRFVPDLTRAKIYFYKNKSIKQTAKKIFNYDGVGTITIRKISLKEGDFK